MSGLLVGKRIVVTGATGGIGRVLAGVCAREGAIVGVACRDGEAAAALAAELEGAEVLTFDLRDGPALQRELAAFVGRRGGIDGLVNNAGITAAGLLVRLDEALIREALEVDLLAPILCVRAVLQPMLKQRAGVVVNIGSVAATRPYAGQTAYAAAKGGLEAFTRALAVEYARKGIRAHCVVPGAIATEMLDSSRALGEEKLLERVPMRRLGSPEDVAELVAFLLSDKARYLTGTTHVVDGGYVIG